MARNLALLGSINVGGNRLKMADLKAALEMAGLADVETVIASGNVLFDPQGAAAQTTEKTLADVLGKTFGLAGMVTVRTAEEVRAAIEANPFHDDGEDKFVHTIFLDGQPDQARFDALLDEHRAKGGERLALGRRMLFLDYVYGVGVSSLTGAFLERRLACRGTARNMRSLKRILAKMA